MKRNFPQDFKCLTCHPINLENTIENEEQQQQLEQRLIEEQKGEPEVGRTVKSKMFAIQGHFRDIFLCLTSVLESEHTQGHYSECILAADQENTPICILELNKAEKGDVIQ